MNKPIALAKAIPTALPRGLIRCCQCGDDFEAILGVIPHCMPCEHADPTSVPERLAMRAGGWQAVLDLRQRRRLHDTEGRLEFPAHYQHAEPTEPVAQWCASPARPLVLNGAVGRGKTWQACAAARWIAQRREHGQAIMLASASLGRLDGGQIARARGALVLVLDDIGSRITPACVATAVELIDARLGDEKPLIVTTNLDRAGLGAIDERLQSRLAGVTWLRLDGPDRRIA